MMTTWGNCLAPRQSLPCLTHNQIQVSNHKSKTHTDALSVMSTTTTPTTESSAENSTTQTAVPAPAEAKAEKLERLCKHAKTRGVDDAYKDKVRGATFVCGKCGRCTNNPKFVCVPKKL
ncbi:hypothetical protein Pelo_7439 [Pelomyxa schiedti]|nr:hypothetical protein Pelo_7439 [Pelomyxa schiedti]